MSLPTKCKRSLETLLEELNFKYEFVTTLPSRPRCMVFDHVW